VYPALFVAGIDVQHLPAPERLTDRDDQLAARLELPEQLRRRILGDAGQHDGVEPALDLRPAEIAVADTRMDIVIAQRREDLPDRLADRLDDLDRVGVAHDPAEQAGLEAGAGADLQRHIARLRRRQLAHIGLAKIVGQDAAVADSPGLGIVLIGLPGRRGAGGVGVVEIVAGHALERRQHRRIGRAELAFQIGLDPRHGRRLARLDGGELGLADRWMAARGGHRLAEHIEGPGPDGRAHRGRDRTLTRSCRRRWPRSGGTRSGTGAAYGGGIYPFTDGLHRRVVAGGERQGSGGGGQQGASVDHAGCSIAGKGSRRSDVLASGTGVDARRLMRAPTGRTMKAMA